MTDQDNRPADPESLRQKAEAYTRERAARRPEDSEALSAEKIQKTLHELQVHQIELEMQNEELRTAQTQIEAGRARYYDLYDLAPVGYCTLSEQGLILEVNLTAATLLGTTRGLLVKQPITRFIFKEDQDIYYLHRKQLFEASEVQECELRLVKPNGERFWAHLTTTAAQAEDGALLCRVVISDITERKQDQLALKQKNQELEQFAHSVSHDLKSPLITVKSFVGKLRQDLLDADQQQINDDLNYIGKAADKLQLLLDALLQYSRVDRFDAPAQTLSASQPVKNCLASLAGILQQHQVQVSSGELTRQLHGDVLQFERIWQNLIENAVKYRGDQPHPQIKIGATQQGQNVVFYVRDNGMGVAPEHSERIFDLFSQLNPGSEGGGLGLALVKKIVSIYQGRIWVESAGENKGSCFMFTLPGALTSSEVTE